MDKPIQLSKNERDLWDCVVTSYLYGGDASTILAIESADMVIYARRQRTQDLDA